MSTASVTYTFVDANVAEASEANQNFTDLVSFLNSNVVHLDGAKTMTGNLPMGTTKLTGLAAGSEAGNSVRYEQVLLLAGGTMSGAIAMGTNKITGMGDPTAAQDAATKTYVDNRTRQQVVFAESGTLSTKSGTIRARATENRTIVGVWIDCDTAPTDAAILVDVHKDGTTIFTTQGNRPTIAAAGKQGTEATPDVTDWDDDEYLTVDIDQVGSTIAGADLTVTIVYTVD